MSDNPNNKSPFKKFCDSAFKCFLIAVILFLVFVGLAKVFKSCPHWMGQVEKELVRHRR